MKILQVMASCAQVSGVAQTVMNYYRHICMDVTFDFLVFWENDATFRKEIEHLGGKVFRTPEPSIRHFSRYYHAVDSFFATHAREYSAVQLHDLYLNPVIFTIAKKYEIPVRIAHSHANKLSEHTLGKMRNWVLYRLLPCLSTDFWAASHSAGVAAFGKGVTDKKNFAVIDNAIDLKKFYFNSKQRERVRQEFNIDKDTFVLGHIGRFAYPKNHEFLLRIFAEIKHQKENSRLLLVGDGGRLRTTVITQAKELGLADSVIFTNFRKDIGAILSAMDVFCLPSRFEGLGIVLLEAQANGLPCIASDSVPVETAILPTYRQCSLTNPPLEWANTILASQQERFMNPQALVRDRGFDISDAASQLLDRYLELNQRQESQ